MRFLRERSDFGTAAKFARHVEVPEVTYRAHETGLRGFSEPAARKYAAELGANWAWLITGEGSHRIQDKTQAKELNAVLASLPQPTEVQLTGAQPAMSGKSDLPVYASAEGGPSGMVVTPDPIDWIKRPEPLLNVQGAFAVYVIGDSMEPRYEQGDMILVHPSRPVQQNDDVLLAAQRDDGSMAALIKRLVRWNTRIWSVRQYNPKREYDLARAEWQLAYVVIGKYNRR